MPRQIDLVGKSGALYRYSTIDENRFLPPAGANYVIAEVKGDAARVVFVGETDNLANQNWRPALEQALQTHGKVQVLTRLNVTRAVRKAEEADLIEQHMPPLNQ